MEGLKDRIAGSNDLPIEPFHVPEWDMDVWLRMFTGSERANWERSTVKEVDGELVRDLDSIASAALRLAALTLVDEQGNRIFEDVDEGIAILGEKNAKAVTRIAEKASEINELGAGAVTEAMEDLEETPESAMR